MKLFKSSKQTKAVADFKNSAVSIDRDDAINTITGGTLSGCHPIGGSRLTSLTRFDAVADLKMYNI